MLRLRMIYVSQNTQNNSVAKLIWGYSLPSLIGTLANTLYNVVDRIFIGQGVSAFALSGLALTFPFVSIMSSFSMLVSVGAASVTSISLGGKDHDARLILPNTLLLIFAAYALVTAVCMIFLDEILTLFGGTPNTLPYARQYLTIVIPGHIFTSLGFASSNLIRSTGHPFRAMNILLLGFGLNILLDPLFIFAFDMGIRGAAVSTVISMALTAAVGLSFFIRPDSPISFAKSSFSIDGKMLMRILSIGFSPFIFQFCNSLVTVVLNGSLLTYGGDLALAALGIIASYSSIVNTALAGFTQGLQPIFGFNHGAGNHKRVREILRKAILYSTLISLAGWLVAMLCPTLIARCFISDNPLLIGMAANGLRCYNLLSVLVGFHIVVTIYYQSIDRPNISTLLTFSRQVLFFIPFILLLPRLLNPCTSYLNALWLSQPATTLCSALMALIILRKTHKTQ